MFSQAILASAWLTSIPIGATVDTLFEDEMTGMVLVLMVILECTSEKTLFFIW